MFGFSIQKLLFTILVIVVVWYAFKMIGRLDERRKAKVGSDSPPKVKPGRRAAEPDDSAEDMLACPQCGTYVSRANPSSCGRPDCPYPG